MRKNKRVKALTAILVLTLLLAAQTEPATATPDIFYLHRMDTSNITPAGKYMSTTVPTKDFTHLKMENGVLYYWYSMKTYGPGYFVEAGTYEFTGWITIYDASITVTTTVTFTFGYCNADGSHMISIVSSSKEVRGEPNKPIQFIISATGKTTTLPKEGLYRFYLILTRSGPIGSDALLSYDGADRPTRIETPMISPPAPEFPLPAGLVLIAILVVSAYWLLRKRLPLAVSK